MIIKWFLNPQKALKKRKNVQLSSIPHYSSAKLRKIHTLVQRAIFQATRETTGTDKPADTWQATFSVPHRYCACASIPTRSNLDTAVPKNKGRRSVFIDCLPASWPSCDADSAGAL